METKKLLLLPALLMVLTSGWAQGPNNSGTYYKNANGKKGAALKTELGVIINPHHKIGYDGLFSAYEQTDKRSDGYVRDWYSCVTNYRFSDHGGYKKEGDCYNREHSVPQSWFKGSASAGYLKCDIVHVVPTDGYVNNRRSSFPLAEVSNATYQSQQGYSKLGSCKTAGYNSTVFEPNDEIKGDMARMYFYMVTCYESEAGGWGHNVFSRQNLGFEQWYVDMLMRWSKQDPIDAREIARNDAVYATQQNRNPFVDYPGLEDYIWGDKQDVQFSYDNYEGHGGGQVPTVAMPVFAPDAGTYYNNVEVTLTTATEGATIYYTTDGADASANSIYYEGPFTVSETCVIKAVAIKDGVESYQASAFYQITDDEQPDNPDDPGDEPEEDPEEGGDVPGAETPVSGDIVLCDNLFHTSYGGSISSSVTDDLVGSMHGVTVTYSLADGSNRYVNSSHLRLYPGNKLIFSVEQGQLTGLEFEFASGTPSDRLEADGVALSDATWSGNAKQVVITLASGKHARISNVKVTVSSATGIDMATFRTLDGQRVIYDLSGRRVTNPTRGIYFVDGKKIMIE